MQIRIDLFTWHPAPDVSTQPKMILTHWRVFINAQGERFLTGVLPNGSTLRVTTPIQAVDLVSRMWRTQSGRIYETPGPPAESLELCQALALMVGIVDPSTHPDDVTDVFWADMQRAVQ